MENVIQMTSLANDLMLLGLHAYPPCGLKQVSMLVHLLYMYTMYMYMYIVYTNSQTITIMHYIDISMRSDTIAYFISTVTVILHACV